MPRSNSGTERQGGIYGPARYGLGPYHQRLRSRKRSDDELREEVQEALFYDTWVDADAITVEVREGVVFLQGELPDYDEIRYATDDVWDVEGVRGVRSELTVRGGAGTQVNPVELAHRFEQHLQRLGADGARILVALSGGRDSAVLLHLLRFGCRLEPAAAHLDHGMRPDSAADAEWVAGLCRAWGVPLISARLREPPRSEDAARQERYRFLCEAARAVDAERIAQAHHGDDQAETVLFRALRGTGLRGLAGMAPLGPGVLIRPLLGFRRREVTGYARAVGLRWREDPTNRKPVASRNRIRGDLLPRAERVAPGARASLIRLAELARENEAAWDEVLGELARHAVRTEGDAVVLMRDAFRSRPAVAPLLFRHVLRRLGGEADAAGTRLAVQFITHSASGREFRVGNLRLLAEFDEVRIEHIHERGDDAECVLRIDQPTGSGVLRIGGRERQVSWRVEPWSAEARADVALVFRELQFPLLLRGPAPGDRIRLRAGSRSLKRLWNDRRVPGSQRLSTPVVVDAGGTLLGVAGIAGAADFEPRTAEDALLIHMSDG